MAQNDVLRTIVEMCEKNHELAKKANSQDELYMVYTIFITSIAAICSGALAMDKKEIPVYHFAPKNLPCIYDSTVLCKFLDVEGIPVESRKCDRKCSYYKGE